MRQEVSAGGLVFRRGGGRFEVLLIRDRFHYWTLPKGHLDPGETPAQAALREIVEETGIEGRIVSELPTTQYEFFHRDGRVTKTVRYFLVEAMAGTLQPQEGEVCEVRWFKPAEVAELRQYDNNRPILDQALAMLSDAREKGKD